MGYYTAYNLNYKEMGTNEALNKAIAAELVKLVQFQNYTDDLEECSNYQYLIEDMFSSDVMKWYDHDEDMLILSRKFPDITFVLDGNGEGDYFNPDIWRTYYRNGEMQECSAVIQYEPHDPKFDL